MSMSGRASGSIGNTIWARSPGAASCFRSLSTMASGSPCWIGGRPPGSWPTGKNGSAGPPSKGPSGWAWWCSTGASWSWPRPVLPNLASRSLALAIKALPEHWEQAHGYKPLLAETFSDIEQYEGTSYKASNWIACGQTKGFERHRIDYYRQHGRPKKLWLKTLNSNARRLLTAMDLPPAYRPALHPDTPERDLPLKKTQLESLGQFLIHLPQSKRSF